MSLSDGEKQILERIGGIRDRHDAFLNAVGSLKQPLEHAMAQLAELLAVVKQNNDVTKSAIELLNGLTKKLGEVQTPEDLTELKNAIEEDTRELAAAVAANTPASPQPPPDPVPEPTPVE